MIEPNNLTVSQFMTYQNISRKTAYRLVHDESFYPAFRIGKKILINLDKLRKWNFEQGMKGGGAGDENI